MKNGDHNLRWEAYITMGNTARGMAFCTVAVILLGTAVGSMLPETGNVAAIMLDVPAGQEHIFNPVFFALGFVGIVLACYIGYRKCE